MEPNAESAIQPRRITVVRGTIAFLIFVLLLGVAVGYHDGLFDIDPIESDPEPGLYRFKGTITSWDQEGESFVLERNALSMRFHWNVSTPDVGQAYVVSAHVDEGDPLVYADALSWALIFR